MVLIGLLFDSYILNDLYFDKKVLCVGDIIIVKL